MVQFLPLAQKSRKINNMKDLLQKPKLIICAILIAIVYTISVVYLMNGNFVKDTLLGNFPLDYKFNLMTALLAGMWTAMTGSGLLILLTTAILTGLNITLIFQRLTQLRSAGSLHFVVGGSSILGMIGSGCAACGLPILAILGLSGSVAYLPFRGTEISIVAIILLSMSLFLMVKSSNPSKVCEVKVRSQIV